MNERRHCLYNGDRRKASINKFNQIYFVFMLEFISLKEVLLVVVEWR